MFHKYSVRVKPSDIFSILEIQVVELVCKFINFVHTSEYKIPNFPRQRNEFLFSFFMKKVQPKVIFPCNFCNKNYVRYMAWKKGRIFLGTENPYDIVILHFIQCPLSIQELTILRTYYWDISSKENLFKNQDNVVENLIKKQGNFVPP
jgi:hypothetical protein